MFYFYQHQNIKENEYLKKKNDLKLCIYFIREQKKTWRRVQLIIHILNTFLDYDSGDQNFNVIPSTLNIILFKH